MLPSLTIAHLFILNNSYSFFHSSPNYHDLRFYAFFYFITEMKSAQNYHTGIERLDREENTNLKLRLDQIRAEFLSRWITRFTPSRER